MTRNFNVGDVVINLQDLQFWNNTFHFTKTLSTFKKELIVSATDRFFTTFSDIDLGKFNGFSSWEEKVRTCTQEDGKAWEGRRAYVNLTTREDDLRAKLQSLFDVSISACDNADVSLISKLESEIAHKQKQIEDIKAGRRTISYDNKIIERVFINERITALLEVVDSLLPTPTML